MITRLYLGLVFIEIASLYANDTWWNWWGQQHLNIHDAPCQSLGTYPQLRNAFWYGKPAFHMQQTWDPVCVTVNIRVWPNATHFSLSGLTQIINVRRGNIHINFPCVDATYDRDTKRAVSFLCEFPSLLRCVSPRVKTSLTHSYMYMRYVYNWGARPLWMGHWICTAGACKKGRNK